LEVVKRAIIVPPAGKTSLTAQDWHIWSRHIVGNLDLPINLWSLSIQQDRSDADLMYRIELCRKYEREHPAEFAEYAGYGWVHDALWIVLSGNRVQFADSDRVMPL
jgi:hypothetical protein